MSQSRFGGQAVASNVAKYDDFALYAPPARRKGKATMAAGAATAGVGAGMLSSAARFTPEKAIARARSAQSAAAAARAETAAAATAVGRAKKPKAQARAKDEYRRKLVASSSKQNYYDATRRSLRTYGRRRLKVAGVGGAALAGGLALTSAGVNRWRNS